jgi:hypothetical protein
MVLRNAGLVTAISSFILSFTGAADTAEGLRRALWIGGGIGVLWLLSLSQLVDRWLSLVIRWALNRWTDLEVRDYARLLDLSGDYSVRELRVRQGDWLVGKRLGETSLQEEGILVLGIRRENGKYIGAPVPETDFRANDLLILYGDREAIRNLDRRTSGPRGDEEHEQAKAGQRQRALEEHRGDV